MHVPPFARFSIAALFASLLSAVGCAGGPSPEGCPAASDRTAYPSTGVGVTDGDVLEAHSFLKADGSSFGLSDIFANPDNRLLLLSTGAGWCTACLEEQPAIEALYQAHKDQGFTVMVALFEDSQFQPSTPQLAADWATDNEVTFPVVADPDFQMDAYYDSSLTPMNMLVAVDTMEILRIATGYDENAVTSTIDAILCSQ